MKRDKPLKVKEKKVTDVCYEESSRPDPYNVGNILWEIRTSMVVDGELKRFGSEVAFSSLEMQKSFVAGDIYREKLENSRCSLLCLVGTDVSPEAEKLLKREIEKKEIPPARP